MLVPIEIHMLMWMWILTTCFSTPYTDFSVRVVVVVVIIA
jgi:hypothetical protein